jgi:hypothetical protein
MWRKAFSWLYYGIFVCAACTTILANYKASATAVGLYATAINQVTISVPLAIICSLPLVLVVYLFASLRNPLRLKVEAASYGFETAVKDVTDIVRKRIRNNQVAVIASNENLGGDPCPHKIKRLTVSYSIGKTRATKSIGENDMIELP